jgi:8-amino-7-oxononanoate synthase
MGTLGKAYGSFGAYILSSAHVSAYLVNRAKPVIYATAPTLIDTALAEASLHYILEHAESLGAAIERRRTRVQELLGVRMDGLIAAVPVGDNRKVMDIQQTLLEKEKVLVGAIRQPTVPSAIVRLIARTNVPLPVLERSCRIISGALK